MAKVVSIKRTVWDQLYVPGVVRGLTITLRHFFVNAFAGKQLETLRYGEWDIDEPEDMSGDRWRGRQKMRHRPERFRGRHRLMKRPDGSVRCTACMMCATICPANCIHIEAGEREKPMSREIEKYPEVFEIDELICVVCGLCVEACPCDALRMDTMEHIKPVERRADAVLDKAQLMSRGANSIAVDGGAGADWREQYDPTLGALRQVYRPDRYYEDKGLGYRGGRGRSSSKDQ